MSADIVRFVHISDTHLGAHRDDKVYGVNPYQRAKRLINVISELPDSIDFIVHTGDVVHDHDESAYALAKELFSAIELPVYYVSGNHDLANGIKQNMTFGPKQDLGELSNQSLCYSFEVKKHKFIVLDCGSGKVGDHHGSVPQSQLDYLKNELASSTANLSIFLHYPALPLDAVWIDRDMLLTNGTEFHQVLLTAKDKLGGVFYGHIHRAIQVSYQGVLYVSAPSIYCQLSAWPGDQAINACADEPSGFNLVSIDSDKTVVKQVNLT